VSCGLSNLTTVYERNRVLVIFDATEPWETLEDAEARGAQIEADEENTRDARVITQQELDEGILNPPPRSAVFSDLSFRRNYNSLTNRIEFFEQLRVTHQKPYTLWMRENVAPLVASSGLLLAACTVALRGFYLSGTAGFTTN